MSIYGQGYVHTCSSKHYTFRMTPVATVVSFIYNSIYKNQFIIKMSALQLHFDTFKPIEDI